MPEEHNPRHSSLLGPLPDPDRVGGPGWLHSTGGRLTNAQRARMLATSLTTQRRLMSQRLRRRVNPSLSLDDVLQMPDTRLVRDAEEAALCQSRGILAHGYRSAVFARALALIDGVDVDHELLVVCALLHDAGLFPSVAGEDFTLRSATLAADVTRNAGHEEACDHVFDAVVVHTTIGIDATRDGALGAYTQFGAMVDLAGLRERHLPHDLVSRVLADHPRKGFASEILKGLGAEARAVPGGRFAFLRCVGFGPAVRLASLPTRRR
ncbi:MAG: hypothetical protein RLZ94_548 [Actinomycetota bacterium]